jgi:hypothetical protein
MLKPLSIIIVIPLLRGFDGRSGRCGNVKFIIIDVLIS